jgi:predicted transcriptional regulator
MSRKSIQHPGRTLAKKRRMVGMTQHEVAELANVSLTRIVYGETGRLDLEPEEVARVRQVLRQRLKQVVAEVV